jgi:hypothetical protein
VALGGLSAGQEHHTHVADDYFVRILFVFAISTAALESHSSPATIGASLYYRSGGAVNKASTKLLRVAPQKDVPG